MTPAREQIDVSVVVPVGPGDDRRVQSLLRAIRTQRTDGMRVEVVLADNAPAPRTSLASLAADDVQVVHEPAPGAYRARNTALGVVRGDVIAFTDADAVPATDWLRRAVARLGDGVGLVAGGVVLDRPRRWTGTAVLELLTAFPQEHYASDGWAATVNAVTRREVMAQVGAFDESLQSSGDREFGRRVVAAGWRVVHASDAVVSHPPRERLRDLVAKRRRVLDGRAVMRGRGELAGEPLDREVRGWWRPPVSVARALVAEGWAVRHPVASVRAVAVAWALRVVTALHGRARHPTAPSRRVRSPVRAASPRDEEAGDGHVEVEVLDDAPSTGRPETGP